MSSVSKVILQAKKQVEYHSIYLWGAQGEKVRNLSVKKIIKMETSAGNAKRVLNFIGSIVAVITNSTRAFDCSGFICWLLCKYGILPKGYDNTADGLMNKFKVVLPAERKPGDLVFKCYHDSGKAYHVGLYIGDNKVVEAKGRDQGVIVSTFDTSWDNCRRPEYT